MHKALKKWAKYLLKLAPVPLTKNEQYDRLTELIIKRVCTRDSLCIDVGANEGKILAMFIRHCPAAVHFAFEPIPLLYKLLVRKFGSASRIYQVALSDNKGSIDYNVTESDMAYSGIKKRIDKDLNYFTVVVKSDLLDNIIPSFAKISVVKIDVEGAEYHVLMGAERILHQHKPFVLFEYGQGGSDAYNISPQTMFSFFDERGYQVNMLNSFLEKRQPLTVNHFAMHYRNRTEYFFIASPLVG